MKHVFGKSHAADLDTTGVFLKDGETVERVDTDTGQKALDQLEDERTFEAADIERSITAPDSNRKIIEEVAKYAYEHEAKTGRFPKTLIFAVNDMPHTSHADQLVKICRAVFNQGDDFVKKITGNPNVDRPLQRIREFRNRPNPKVVVTVDMLSTGVDIPALEFIVFLRPVKSRILWEQMQWLSRVREHWVKNLSMDEEDFDLTPLLEMRGGKAKARKVFNDLPHIVAELNPAVAA